MIESHNPRCSSCGTQRTPMWRRGPDGVIMCNACGIRWARYGRVDIEPAQTSITHPSTTEDRSPSLPPKKRIPAVKNKADTPAEPRTRRRASLQPRGSKFVRYVTISDMTEIYKLCRSGYQSSDGHQILGRALTYRRTSHIVQQLSSLRNREATDWRGIKWIKHSKLCCLMGMILSSIFPVLIPSKCNLSIRQSLSTLSFDFLCRGDPGGTWTSAEEIDPTCSDKIIVVHYCNFVTAKTRLVLEVFVHGYPSSSTN